MTAQLLMVLYAHAPGWGDGERGGAGEAALDTSEMMAQTLGTGKTTAE